MSSCRASTIDAGSRSSFRLRHVADNARSMHILFIGDIFGKPGREIARRAIPALVEQRGIDFVIANVENSAAGFGVTGDIADTILSYGVDVMTSGNHIWDKKEVLEYIPRSRDCCGRRTSPPASPAAAAIVGRTRTGEPVGVINVMGRVFMTPLDDPFARRAARRSRRCAPRRASSSSTSTPRRRRRKSPWAGTSTAASPRSSARTPTCRPPTSASCRKARPTSPTRA